MDAVTKQMNVSEGSKTSKKQCSTNDVNYVVVVGSDASSAILSSLRERALQSPHHNLRMGRFEVETTRDYQCWP